MSNVEYRTDLFDNICRICPRTSMCWICWFPGSKLLGRNVKIGLYSFFFISTLIDAQICWFDSRTQYPPGAACCRTGKGCSPTISSRSRSPRCPGRQAVTNKRTFLPVMFFSYYWWGGAGRVYDVKKGPAFVSCWMFGFQHVWIDYWIEAVGLSLELQFKDVSLLCNKVASWSVQEFKS